MSRAARVAVLSLTIAAIALSPRAPAATRGAEACGPYALDFAFVRVAHPDDPGAYVAGRLGVVQPSFRLPWLVTAYRHLSGTPLTAGEQKALWNAEAAPGRPLPPGAVFGSQRWLKVKRDVLKEPEQYAYVNTFAFDPMSGAYYDNCPDAAFEQAARTLQDRVAAANAGDPAIAAWIAAQDQVFANCGHERDAAAQIPAELDASASAAARADRAYQIAAAHFYAGQWDAAVARFRAVGADRTSPWQPWGEYLAGRALLRKGTLGPKGGGLDTAALGEASAVFARIAADPASPLRASAAGLVRFIDLRLKPDAMRPDVIGRLLAARGGETFEEDLAEYRYLFLRNEPASSAPPATGRAATDPLTDWIDTLRSEAPDALAHAVSRWRQSPAQTAWLVAAMLRVPPGHTDEAALVAAAAAVPPASPAWPTLAFHRARLLVRGGRLDEARALAAEMTKASADWPASARNQLRALDLRLVTTFDAFLAAALQAPVGFASEDDMDVDTLGPPKAVAIGHDALDMVNERWPLARLVEAAGHAAWPAALRTNARLGALARALLLDDADAIGRLDAAVREADPALGADLDARRLAATAEERRFLTILLLVRRPGLRPFMTGGERRSEIDWAASPPTITPDALTGIDGLRDNWWCALSPSPVRTGGTYATYQAYQPGMYARSGPRLDRATAALYDDPAEVPTPAFLAADERARAEREWQALDAIDTAPDFFAREVLAYADTHPADARVAEALHLVVRATRYGCTSDATGDLSRQAFTQLHTRFPKSEWAKKTPYWFR